MKDKIIRVKTSQMSSKELDKYAGKHIALIKNKVVGWGGNVLEAYQMAKKKFPKIESDRILLTYLPREGLLIL
jgi:hypothetical protein